MTIVASRCWRGVAERERAKAVERWRGVNKKTGETNRVVVHKAGRTLPMGGEKGGERLKFHIRVERVYGLC